MVLVVSEGEEGNVYLSSTCSSVPLQEWLEEVPRENVVQKEHREIVSFTQTLEPQLMVDTRERVDVFQKDVSIL